MPLNSKITPVHLFSEKYVPENCQQDLPPIIFIHGFCAIYTTWDKVKKKIAENTSRQVFTLNLRNHGQSEWTEVSNLESMVGDLENFMVEKEIEKAVLVGHSLGGRVAAMAALKKPELVSKLIVEDSDLENPTEEFLRPFISMLENLKNVRFFPKHYTEKELQQFLLRMFERELPEVSIPKKDSLMVPLHKEPDGTFTLDVNVDSLTKSLKDSTLYSTDLKEIQPKSVPALFMYGEMSIRKVKEDESIQKYFLNARFYEMKKAVHHLHLEFPEEFIEEVCKFITNP